MATVSYGLKITEAYHVFDKTITIYRNAVHYMSCTHSIVVQKKSNPYSHAERIAGTRLCLVFFVFWEILHAETNKKIRRTRL